MIQLACINLPELPLQLLLQQHPDWQPLPAVVVDEDKASGVILWANERARADCILPGMRYAAGLSLSRELRGGVIRDSLVEQAMEQLTGRLDQFSPGVEPCSREPGIFWLEAQGLLPLYPSWTHWIQLIDNELRQAGFHAVIAAGFTRFGTYAAAKSGMEGKGPQRQGRKRPQGRKGPTSGRRATPACQQPASSSGRSTLSPSPSLSLSPLPVPPYHLFASPTEEKTFIREVPLNRLGIQPRLRDALHKLGIDHLGPFADLPSEGVRKRFGREAYELHRQVNASAESDNLPIQPREVLEPIERTHSLDHPEKDLERMLHGIERLLGDMLNELQIRAEALSVLELTLTLDNGTVLHETLTPAGCTRKLKRILPLVRLRLETLQLSSGVVDFHILAKGLRVTTRQLELLEQATQRDLEAVHRAFAEIRAELGNQAVVHARLHDRHLPEARYTWDPLEQLPPARYISSSDPPLVRRIYTRPRSLPRPLDVKEVIGPHVVSGAWWSQDVSRAYYYLRAESGRWFWVFKDLNQGRWFLHGEAQ